MAETMTLPGVGAVPTKTVYIVGAAAGGIVAYAWWRSRGAADEDDVILPPEDPYEGLTDTGGNMGGVSGYDSTGSSDSTQTGPKTIAEWSAIVRQELVVSYDITAIDDALGRYVTRKPLTALDMRIVQAAIAVAGYPPGGTYTLIPGGDAEITVAPAGLRAVPSFDRATISWGAVPGATQYRMYRTDQSTAAPQLVTGTSNIMYNLDPAREYKVQVSAVSASGKEGPKSSQVTFKTPAPTLKAPTGLKVVTGQISKTSVRLQWNAVAGARGYRAFRTGLKEPISTSTGTSMQIGGLKPNTAYRISIRAESGVGEGMGPASTISIRTKK